MKKQVAPRTMRELMTVKPVTVRPETTLVELKKLFEEHDFDCFPVLDGNGVLVGVASQLDLLRAFRSADRIVRPDRRAAVAERVVDVMSRGVVSVGPDDLLSDAIDLMVDFRLHTLPVVEKRMFDCHLLGLVSQKDVLRWLSMVEQPESAHPQT